MTVSVLTDNQGRYVVENLPAGDYRLAIRAIGYNAEAKSGMKLTADQNCRRRTSRCRPAWCDWTDISILQGLAAPAEATRQADCWSKNCMGCHGFQSKMAAYRRDADGWRSRVEFMREAMRASLADRRGFTDQQAEDVVYYLNKCSARTRRCRSRRPTCRTTRTR